MTTAAQQPAEDGNLPAARRRLEFAVWALIDPRTPAPSLYQQLQDAIPGQQGTAHGSHARSLPPLWIEGCHLLIEIDTALAIWQPAFDGVPPTVGRFRHLLTRGWRPQDCRSMDQISAACEAWAVEIVALLEPEPQWSLPDPCPACQTKTVYRKDSSGERVRKPALSIGANGCTCLNCHHVWAPDLMVHLGRVLGYRLPDGVLE